MPYDLLSGVRVVEVAMYAFAPSCTAVLADWGADVVKVVRPTVADPMAGNIIAGLPDKEVGIAFMWQIMNRGKRSVGIDVSIAEGRQVLDTLIADADVFVTHLLPDARERYRLDPEDIRAVKSDIVYARATGHGPRGPEAPRGGYDHTDFWARTGIGQAASLVSDEFVPQPGPAMGDLASGAFLAGGIAAALLRRERTGQGAIVDVSLLSAGMWMFSPGAVASQLYDVDTIPRRRHHEQPNPLVTAYATKDRRLVYLAGIRTDKGFEELCEVLHVEHLVTDPRFQTGELRIANSSALIAEMDEAFGAIELADLLPGLERVTTPWNLVQTAREAATDEQVVANGYVVQVDGGSVQFPLVASPAQFDEQPPALGPAPEHGQDTETLLLDAGLSWDRIAELKELGAIL